MKDMKRNLGKTLVLAMTLVALPAYADDSEAQRNEALALYEKGKGLMKAEEWEKAEQEYTNSLQTFPMTKTRGMLGYVQVKRGNYLDGVRNLEWFFQEDTTVEVDKREQVRPQYVLAKKNVATIKLKIAPLDAIVAIDGVTIPSNQVPWPQYVSAGKQHTVEVKKDGYIAQQERVTLGMGIETEVELKLVAIPAGQGPKAIDSKVPPKPAKMPPLVMAAWIGGGVLGAVAIGTGIGAVRTYKPMEDDWHYRNCGNQCGLTYNADKSQLAALSTTALVSGVLGLGALGFAIRGTVASVSTRTSLNVVPTRNGLLFVGSW
jgi:hypothetical protein